MELNDNDVVTVRGIGIRVYSVTRTKGHGYIRLANYSYFTGGTVNVGNSIILPVTDNMLIAAGEGSYRVVLGKGGTKAVKNVTSFFLIILFSSIRLHLSIYNND